MNLLKSKFAAILLPLSLFAFCAFFSGNSLKQGQQIKQFASYSVTQSLAENGFRIFKTYWPCVDTRNGAFPRPWAEEPPVFYLYSAALEKMGLGPQWAPLFVFLIFNLILFLFLREWRKDLSPFLFLVAATIPVQMRYSYQHIPDMVATLFLLTAVLLATKKNGWGFVLCLLFAVTTKALAIIPASLFLLVYYFERSWKRLLGIGLLIALVSLPFLFWVETLWSRGIPNPFDFRHPLTNRHSGEFGIVFTTYFWDRVFTFVATKGVGWILFLTFLTRLKRDWQRRAEMSLADRLLCVWALSVVPFWFLVRSGSTIHDHYVLQYGIAIGIVGAEALLRIKQPKLRHFLVLLSIGMGLSNPVVWRLRTQISSPPSKFCEQEEHSLVKFPLR